MIVFALKRLKLLFFTSDFSDDFFASLFCTVSFFIFSLFITSNKMFFVLVIVFVSVQYVLLKSFLLTFFISYFPINLFSTGQVYTFLIIPKESLLTPIYPDGRFMYFVLTPAFLVTVSGFFVSLFSLFNKKLRIRFSLPTLFFMLCYFISLVTAIKSQFLPHLSVLYWITNFASILLYIVGQLLFSTFGNIKFTQILNLLLGVVLLCVMFQALIAFVQVIKGNSLGLIIESVKSLPFFGSGSDEFTFIVRPVGLKQHANLLANEVILFSFLIIHLNLFTKRIINPFKPFIVEIVLIISFFLILFTQSRAAILAIVVSSLFPLYSYKHQIIKDSIPITRYMFKFKYLFFPIFIVSLMMLTNRALFSLNSFQSGGGFRVRSQLQTEAIGIAEKSSFSGVGFGMYIPAAFFFNPLGIMQWFPEAVHNGFWLRLVEDGVLYLLLFGIGLFLLVKNVTRFPQKSFQLSIWGGIVSQMIVMIFQPVNNFTTPNLLIICLLMSLSETNR